MSLDDEPFRNVMPMGQYFYYQLLPGNSEEFGFLDSLTVQIENIIGDADLMISTTKQLPQVDDIGSVAMGSRRGERFEAIQIVKEENFTLNRPIYIGVYA